MSELTKAMRQLVETHRKEAFICCDETCWCYWVDSLCSENERLEEGIDKADNLLGCSLEYVEDMVGVASAARGLPEEIIAWRKEFGSKECEKIIGGRRFAGMRYGGKE